MRTGQSATEPAVHGALARRMLIASGLLALLVCAAFSVLLLAINQQRNTARLARHSQQVLSTANQLERLIVDLETGARGYLLTGQQSFLAPWAEARAAFPGTAAELEQLAGVPDQNRRAKQIVKLGQSYIKDYSVPLVSAALEGDPAAKSPRVIAEGRDRLDVLRADFQALESNEEEVAAKRDHNAHVAAQRAVLAAILGVGASVVCIIAFAVYLGRAIVRPVRRTAEMAGQLAGGNLDARLPEDGVGEIGLLERSFNTMGVSLARNRRDLSRLVDEQAALRRVATFVARGVAPAEVFAVVTEEVGRLLEAAGTRMLRYESDGQVTVVAAWGELGRRIPVGTRVSLDGGNVAAYVLESGAPSRIDDVREMSGPLAESLLAETEQNQQELRSAVGAPIVVEGRVWGVMTAFAVADNPLPNDAETRFAEFTDLVATAIANTEARRELAASRARVVAATDRTRRTIERDLHDGTQQRLVSLALDLRSIETRVPAADPELRTEIGEVAAGLGAALEELRELSRGIHPAILNEGGLGPAMKALARRSAVPVDLDLKTGPRVDPRIEVAAYYVVAESLTNIAKHAAAEVARVAVAQQDGRLRLTISDDGIGGAEPRHGSGLIGLIDRVAAVEGKIAISSPAGVGTTIRVDLPTELDEPE